MPNEVTQMERQLATWSRTRGERRLAMVDAEAALTEAEQRALRDAERLGTGRPS